MQAQTEANNDCCHGCTITIGCSVKYKKQRKHRSRKYRLRRNRKKVIKRGIEFGDRVDYDADPTCNSELLKTIMVQVSYFFSYSFL